MTDSTDNTKVIKLKEGNYPTWAGEVSAYLRTKHVWRIVTGEEEAPSKVLKPEYLAWLDKSCQSPGISPAFLHIISDFYLYIPLFYKAILHH